MFANSNCPGLRRWAPVNAPFSWPKSSDSSSSWGIAAQLTLTNGPWRRAEAACTARAMRSLPTPLSPRINTVVSVSAMLSMTERIARIRGWPSKSEGADVATDSTRSVPTVPSRMDFQPTETGCKESARRWQQDFRYLQPVRRVNFTPVGKKRIDQLARSLPLMVAMGHDTPITRRRRIDDGGSREPTYEAGAP